MKFRNIPAIIPILFISACVDTYTIKDFNSPQEFYNKVNKKVEDRTVKVVTNSNEVYEADSLNARPDSIIFMTTQIVPSEKFKSSYNISEIKEMRQSTDYYNDEMVHNIQLNNGDIVTAKYILLKGDSLYLNDVISGMSTTKRSISLATKDVNLISFNNRLTGMAEGAGFYALLGILVGIRNADITSGDQDAIPPEFAAIAGAIVFGLGGAVIGTVTGSYQDYVINEPGYNYHGLTSVELVGGISNSYLGITINGNNSSSGQFLDYSAGISLVWSFSNNIGLKSGLFYSSKGGSFDQLVPPSTFAYHRDIFVTFIELPLLFQYSFRETKINPRLYAGPQFDFFRNGRIDNIYNIKDYFSYPINLYYDSINPSEVNSPEYSFVIGAGINFQKYITVDIQYELGLSKFSKSLFDGQVNNVKLNSFSILLGYGL
ncbi:MAG: porin family protein [Ignavibacteriaceae bacterium]